VKALVGSAIYPDLKDKVVVVTGGTDGIGRAAAIMFARQGANVFVAGTSEKKGAEVEQQVAKDGGRCTFVKTDVTDVEAVAALAAKVKEAGSLGVIVNVAGGFPTYTKASTIETSPEDWDRGVRLNLYSVFYCCRALVPLMDKGGSVINITSNAARKAETHAPRYYSTSKAAVQHLTKVLAFELAPAIRVNSVAPGTTLSGRIKRTATPERIESLVKQVPRRKLAEPDEIASAILFLASEEAAHITGITMDVSGGQVML
jgi:NAD(P)-dependent dehydrogenase (short-subunit alcohol dehydrogenase family)